MINTERLTLWVEALESGQYQQGRHALRREDMFCCLGVACDVAITNGLKINAYELESGPEWNYDGNLDSLPRSVREWYGLDESNPELEFPDGSTADCIYANDSGRYGFVDIAAGVRNTFLEDSNG